MNEFRLDRISNIMKKMGIEPFIEEELEYQKTQIPIYLKRNLELPSYITSDIGIYTNLMEEARNSYIYGLFYSSIALIGIASENFCVNLENELNKNKIDKKIFLKDLNQSKRLEYLKSGEIIDDELYNKFDEIRDIRNKYIHIKENKETVKEDALKIINLFNDILEKRFNDNYYIKDGIIILK